MQNLKLEDVCVAKSSNITQNKLESNHGIYPIYGASGKIKDVDFYHQDCDYLAIIKDGSGIGRVSIHPAKSSIIGTMQYIIPKENININYLYHYLRHLDLRKYSTGIAIPHIYFKDYKNESILVPSLEEQKEKAFNLDSIQNLISKKQEKLEKYDLLVKSQFNEMFNEYFIESKNEKKLIELTTFIDYRGKTPEKSDKGIQLITARNVKMNLFSFEPREYIPEENYLKTMTRGFPKYDDVLFTTEAPLGNVCRIPEIKEKYCVGQRLVTLQPKQGLSNSTYIEYALSTDYFRTKMFQKSSGSTVRGIKTKLLKEITIPTPPIELQNQFANFVKHIDKLKFSIKKSIEKLEICYKSLMQEYFG